MLKNKVTSKQENKMENNLGKSVLFITDMDLDLKSGAGVNGKTHYLALKELFGDRMYSVFVDIKKDNTDNDFYFKKPNAIQKMIALLGRKPVYLYPKVVSFIKKIIKQKNIDYVYIDNSVSGVLFAELKKKFPNIIFASFFIDIESDLMRKKFSEQSFFRKWSLKTMIYNEEMTVKYCEKNIVLNQRDDDLYFQYFGKRPHYHMPVSISKNINFPQKPLIHESNSLLRLLFVGVDYWPNVEGIRWFIKKVVPSIDVEFEFWIVGYNMEKYREEWESQDKRIKVFGTVDDLDKYYFESSLVVGPISDGGGMKIKTAEALAYGKRFIGLEESLIGYYDYVDGDLGKIIVKCNNEFDFLNAIKRFYYERYSLKDDSIVEFVSKYFSFRSIVELYKEILPKN